MIAGTADVGTSKMGLHLSTRLSIASSSRTATLTIKHHDNGVH
jgi:hypothetical protein